MLISNARIEHTAELIIPYVRPIIEETRQLSDKDIKEAISAAKKDGKDVSMCSSERSLSMIMEYICCNA